MKKDDRVYLRHIMDAINLIEKYLENVNCDEFMKNHMIQDAVIREIEIIGEATKNISEELKNKYTDIPWRNIAGIRDKLIHGYFGVDLDAVWGTATEDIPKLRDSIKKVLEKIEENGL